MPWTGLQCVSVAFPGQTHFFTLTHIVKKQTNKQTTCLSETTRPRTMVFGKHPHLVDNIKIFSYYGSGTKHDPPGGSPGAWSVSKRYIKIRRLK